MKKINIFFFLSIFLLVSCVASKKSTPETGLHEHESGQTGIGTVQYPVVEPPVMVHYEGRILHIFFHPLVARPETAFRSRFRDHFLEWYVTADEYKKILYELYINDYVLVDINELYSVSHIDGIKRVVSQKPLIPEGKKPLVLSIDDLSYYDFVRRYAGVHKLVIDKRGNIAAWTDNDDGGEISYDLDVVTSLEEFIKKHPGFSVRGARGIIAVTGYEGVLGYRTHELDAPDYEEEKENAIAVVNKLKELGWHFASHSWGHPNMPNISMTWFTNDTNRWDREVRPIVGDTDLFIYPFGSGVEAQEDRHRILRNHGFNVFFGVGAGYTFSERQSYIYSDRRNIDGFYFRTFRNRADRIFDIENVIDEETRRIR
ncbi:MAG: polysaccharide deacetylase family protein [Treponema sp.]|nr:polysaccharide deacetylase family protein [Treponema sp.]